MGDEQLLWNNFTFHASRTGQEEIEQAFKVRGNPTQQLITRLQLFLQRLGHVLQLTLEAGHFVIVSSGLLKGVQIFGEGLVDRMKRHTLYTIDKRGARLLYT